MGDFVIIRMLMIIKSDDDDYKNDSNDISRGPRSRLEEEIHACREDCMAGRGGGERGE